MKAAALAAREPPFGVVETGVTGETLSVVSFLGVAGLLTVDFGVETTAFGKAVTAELLTSLMILTGVVTAGVGMSLYGAGFVGVLLAFGEEVALVAAFGDGEAALSDGRTRVGTLLGDETAEATFGDGAGDARSSAEVDARGDAFGEIPPVLATTGTTPAPAVLALALGETLAVRLTAGEREAGDKLEALAAEAAATTSGSWFSFS